jgi:hypothetical protein
MVRVRSTRAVERADRNAEPNRHGDDSRRCDSLQPARYVESPAGDDDGKAGLLERCGPDKPRGARRRVSICAATGATPEMRLDARFIELGELAVERGREQLSHAIATIQRNLPHWHSHSSSDGLA